jgi:uncharacterized protein (DUF1330 family)
MRPAPGRSAGTACGEERIMAAFVIVDIAVTDPLRYEEYRRLATPTVAEHGGRFLVRGGRTETLEGSWRPRRFVVLEFPSAAAARAWWSSPGYAAAKGLRQASARTQMILVEGV